MISQIRLMAELQEPFPADSVGWKPGKVTGNRCQVLAYIRSRDVMDRLDQVVGPANWKDEYTIAQDGHVLCRLSLRINGEWIAKEDVGGESEQPDSGDRHKAGVSDALKRAAVKWGIGRYLYRLGISWVDYDPVKKKMATTPDLPAWAKPTPVAAKIDPKLRAQVLDLLEPIALEGLVALQEAWRNLARAEKEAVQGPLWEQIKQVAHKADQDRDRQQAAQQEVRHAVGAS